MTRTARFDATACGASPNLCYMGGRVLHGASAYAVYWAGAPGVAFGSSYAPVISGFLANLVSATGRVDHVYAVNGQYGDASGPALDSFGYGGSYVDTTAYPSGGCGSPAGPCLTDAQIAGELRRVATLEGWPLGRGSVFFMLTPPGVGSCAPDGTCAYQPGAGFCAYHSFAGTGPSELIYGVLPYANVPGCRQGGQSPNDQDADPTVNTLSHEHNEMITDPEGDAWLRPDGSENGDLCRKNFAPALGGPAGAQYNQVIGAGRYFLQSEWSNMTAACAASLADTPPVPTFALMPRAEPGQPLDLSAAGSTGAIGSYVWRFDDGLPDQAGPNTRHSFATAGKHLVTLEVVDALGVPASTTRIVNVVDELPSAAMQIRPARRSGTYVFDGRRSTDPDGRIVAYRWEFGDGSRPGRGPVVTHRFRGRTRHTVRITVTDAAGQTAAASRAVGGSGQKQRSRSTRGSRCRRAATPPSTSCRSVP